MIFGESLKDVSWRRLILWLAVVFENSRCLPLFWMSTPLLPMSFVRRTVQLFITKLANFSRQKTLF